MKKIIVYKVYDNADIPVLFEDLESTVNYFRDLIDGIDVDCPIEITKIEMTKKQWKEVPEE